MSAGKIYVFCNTKDCDKGSGDWHSMAAVSEDGEWLAGHICSSHAWARHDMGIDEDGWKRNIYAEHYPDGFEVIGVESDEIDTHEGLQAALSAYHAKRLDDDPTVVAAST